MARTAAQDSTRADLSGSPTARKRIVIDTRENRPYEFDDSVAHALPAGDYSIEGFETEAAVERKSLSDWISTIIHNGARFHRELDKLADYSFAAVVIEAGIPDILSGEYRSEINPSALLGRTFALMQSYPTIHFLFAGDRPHARVCTEKLLRLYAARAERAEREAQEVA